MIPGRGLGGLLLAVGAAACAAGATPEPGGAYLRTAGPSAAFVLSRLPTGLWRVATEGTAPAGEPPDACRMVAIGSLHGSRLVATSDRNADAVEPVTEEYLAPYQGFIVDFSGGSVRVSGPEADLHCDLRGRYRRR
jgi:hypothetical protein